MGRFENHFFVDKNLELYLYFVHCCCFLNSFFLYIFSYSVLLFDLRNFFFLSCLPG